MNWKRVLIGLVAVTVLIAGGALAYNQFFAPPTAVGESALVATAAGESVDNVRFDTGLSSVAAEGRIVPLRQANLTSPTSGQVVELFVTEGGTVEAGAPLLSLDTTDQEVALAQAEAGLAQAEASLAAALAGLEATRTGVRAAEIGQKAAQVQLDLVAADPRPEEIALQERSIDLANATIGQATASQGTVLEGAADSRIKAAEAELRAAQAQIVPIQEQLNVLRRQDNPDEDILSQAERDYAAALAGIQAAQVGIDELQAGATNAQRRAAGSGVAAAAAQRDAAQSQLDLLLAGSQEERIDIAEASVLQAGAGVANAQVRVQQAEASVAQAEAAVVQAQAAVDTANLAIEDRTLTAPFSGTVADLVVELGEIISPGLPVIVLADMSGWQIETTDLTELDVVEVAVGLPVEIRADALPDDVLTGVVTDIATSSQEVRGDITYLVTIALDNIEDLPLRWGMTVFATIDAE